MHKSTSQVSFDACWYNKHKYEVTQTAVKKTLLDRILLVFVILTTFYFYVAQLTIHGEVL